MPRIHNLADNVYGVTDLWRPANIGVNAGFITTSNSNPHRLRNDHKRWNISGKKSREKSCGKKRYTHPNTPPLRPHFQHACFQEDEREDNRP